MISADTLHAVAAHLVCEADMLVEKARQVSELFGPATAASCLERSELFRGYANELLAEAASHPATPGDDAIVS